MTIRAHDEYVAYQLALRFRASRSPYSPWTRIEPSADPDPSIRRWSELAQWMRATEVAEDAQAFRLGTLAKFVDTGIGDTRPPAKILAALLERVADASSDTAYAAELVALALRRFGGAVFDTTFQAFVERVTPLDSARRVRWMLDIAAGATTSDRLSTITRALPSAASETDRAELTLHRLRVEMDSEVARAGARELREQLPSTSARLSPSTPPGADEHRTALIRIRALQELSYRANELDMSREAAQFARQAFEEAIAVGLPASSEHPPHDLGGVDVLAQVAAADWLASSMAASAREDGDSASASIDRQSTTAAFAARRAVLRGRFRTAYEACLDCLDGVGAAALQGRMEDAIDQVTLASSIADSLRSFALETAVSERLARINLRQMDAAETSTERVECAREAIQHSARAGATELVAAAVLGLGRPVGVDVDGIVQSIGGRLRVERVAKLVAMRELTPIATDDALLAWSVLATRECLEGPFSMNSRLDVQRAAIAASAKVLGESVGVERDEQFEAVARRTVSAWSELAAGERRGNALVVRAVSEATGEFVRLPLSRVPIEVVEQLLGVAVALPKNTSRADGSAWLNFVRPAIEVVLGARPVTDQRREEIRQVALSLIPQWSAPDVSAEPRAPGVPPYPPTQEELLATQYRCLLADAPRAAAHTAVTMMTVYCAHFADGRARAGLRFPLRADVALSIAPSGLPGDESALLKVLLDMALCTTLDTGARSEAIDAVLGWLRGPAATVVARMTMLDELRPMFFEEALAVVRSPVDMVPKSTWGFGDPGQIVGALLVACAEVVRQRLATGAMTAVKQLEDLGALAERLGVNESIQIRGSAGNVGATLLLEAKMAEAQRERLAVGFLSRTCDSDQSVVGAALDGFRWGLGISGAQALGERLGSVLALHLGERALTAPSDIQRQARLALRAFQAAGGAEPAVDSALSRANFSEADERAWRRAQLFREARAVAR